MATPSGPVTIVEWHPTKAVRLTLNTQALRTVFHPVADLPVVIISICGAYRTGKSFLMNYLLRYFEDMEKDGSGDWLEDKELTGFEWGQGSEATTKGILLWPRPFIISENGQQTAVILMDTQGLFDENTSQEDSVVMITLSTLMSSIQVYNVLEILREDNLRHFELFLEAGIMALNNEKMMKDWKPFQRLIFLVRDWIDPKRYKYGANGGSEYLQTFMMPNKTMSDGNIIRKNLLRCFERLECFLMPTPGLKATQANIDYSDSEDCDEESPFKGKVSELSSLFRKKLEEFAPFLVGRADIESHAKKWEEMRLTGKDMMELMIQHMTAFQNGSVPKPAATHQALMDVYNRSILSQVLEEAQHMAQQIVSDADSETSDYIMDLDCIVNLSVEKLQQAAKGYEEEKFLILDACQKEATNIVELAKTACKLKIARRQVLCSERCGKASREAKLVFKEDIEQSLLECEPMEDGTLEKIYRKAQDKGIQMFRQMTADCFNQQTNAEIELVDYFVEQLEKAKEQDALKKKKEDNEALVIYQARRQAEGHYITEMDKKYDLQSKYQHKESILEDHSMHLSEAKCIFVEKTGAYDDIMLRTMEDNCNKRVNYYLEKNQHFHEVEKEKATLLAELQVAGAVEEYTACMRSVIYVGSPYCDPIEIHDLNRRAKAKAQGRLEAVLDHSLCDIHILSKQLEDAMDKKYVSFAKQNQINSRELLAQEEARIEFIYAGIIKVVHMLIKQLLSN